MVFNQSVSPYPWGHTYNWPLSGIRIILTGVIVSRIQQSLTQYASCLGVFMYACIVYLSIILCLSMSAFACTVRHSMYALECLQLLPESFWTYSEPERLTKAPLNRRGHHLLTYLYWSLQRSNALNNIDLTIPEPRAHTHTHTRNYMQRCILGLPAMYLDARTQSVAWDGGWTKSFVKERGTHGLISPIGFWVPWRDP